MKMQKCFNGHYYNTALFSICPFCNKQNQPTAPPPQVKTVPAAPPNTFEGGGHTVYIEPQETNQHLQELEREFHQTKSVAPPPPVPPSYAPPVMPAPPQPKSALANEIKGRTIYIEPPQAEPIHPAAPVPPPEPVVQPTASVETATPAFFPPPPINQPTSPQPVFSPPPPIMVSDPPQPTPAASGEKTKMLYGNVEPVVGWLICLKGAYVGESFPLKTGQNFIGRSIQMDVPLLDEESVSRDTHAYIIFEPKKAEFYASNGTGNSLTYLNKELLMQPTRLKTYDILCFGECEYLFMPLCSEQFSWDAYLKK